MRVYHRRIRPSPNEEKAIREQDMKRRRIKRMQQVALQEKQHSVRTRKAFAKKREERVLDEIETLRTEFELEREKKELELRGEYEKALENLGKAHDRALATVNMSHEEAVALEQKRLKNEASIKHRFEIAMQELHEAKENRESTKIEWQTRRLHTTLWDSNRRQKEAEKRKQLAAKAKPPIPPRPVLTREIQYNASDFESTRFHFSADPRPAHAAPTVNIERNVPDSAPNALQIAEDERNHQKDRDAESLASKIAQERQIRARHLAALERVTMGNTDFLEDLEKTEKQRQLTELRREIAHVHREDAKRARAMRHANEAVEAMLSKPVPPSPETTPESPVVEEKEEEKVVSPPVVEEEDEDESEDQEKTARVAAWAATVTPSESHDTYEDRFRLGSDFDATEFRKRLEELREKERAMWNEVTTPAFQKPPVAGHFRAPTPTETSPSEPSVARPPLHPPSEPPTSQRQHVDPEPSTSQLPMRQLVDPEPSIPALSQSLVDSSVSTTDVPSPHPLTDSTPISTHIDPPIPTHTSQPPSEHSSTIPRPAAINTTIPAINDTTSMMDSSFLDALRNTSGDTTQDHTVRIGERVPIVLADGVPIVTKSDAKQNAAIDEEVADLQKLSNATGIDLRGVMDAIKADAGFSQEKGGSHYWGRLGEVEESEKSESSAQSSLKELRDEFEKFLEKSSPEPAARVQVPQPVQKRAQRIRIRQKSTKSKKTKIDDQPVTEQKSTTKRRREVKPRPHADLDRATGNFAQSFIPPAEPDKSANIPQDDSTMIPPPSDVILATLDISATPVRPNGAVSMVKVSQNGHTIKREHRGGVRVDVGNDDRTLQDAFAHRSTRVAVKPKKEIIPRTRDKAAERERNRQRVKELQDRLDQARRKKERSVRNKL